MTTVLNQLFGKTKAAQGPGDCEFWHGAEIRPRSALHISLAHSLC